MGTIHKINRKSEYLAKRYGSKRTTDQDHTGREIDGNALAKVIVICAACHALVLWWMFS